MIVRSSLSLFVVFLTLFLSAPLLANELLDEYRVDGIKNIAKKLDKELRKKKYWSSLLKKRDTTFGYIESYSNILICDKSQSTLEFFTQDSSENYKLKKRYEAYTGKIEGDKYREGDLKTPIGIYNLTEKIEKVDSFYGPLAFVTSYPNIYDKYKGKNGSGIWIHGLPTQQERDEFTKGCIAINNPSIECLDKHINLDKTLLIINEDAFTQEVSKETLALLLSELYSWRYAWIYNDLQSYLSFYDSSFIRFDGLDIEDFTRYKTRIFNKEESKTILFTKINILPYPQQENTYSITFKEEYNSQSFSFVGPKSLIVKLHNNNMKIITEQ